MKNKRRGVVSQLKILSLYLEITSNCDLRCEYCYSESSHNGQNMELPHIEKILREAKAAGSNYIVISGGEPFLHPEIKQILNLINNIGYGSINVITNGTILDRSALELCSLYLVKIQISLHDGLANNEKNLRRHFIEQLSYYNLLDNTSINTVVTMKNIQKLENVIQTAVEYKIPRVIFPWLTYKGRARKKQIYDSIQLSTVNMKYVISKVNELTRQYSGKVEIESLYEDRWVCSLIDKELPGLELRITVNGDVFPCVNLTDKEYILGNAIKDDLGKIATETNLWIIKDGLKHFYNKCKTCAINKVCLKGCPAYGEYIDEILAGDLNIFCGLKRNIFVEKAKQLCEEGLK